ncbi:hypothetical protein QNH39_04545 [Neobacillus novalis]|uniref:Uncharacterized protein n=1 Tax=Neobacillus novalis TaxID=220687 RepID=A0AA95MPN3_9BACI|nr:hypothetical protein [Neobacillus novalis]WHY87137.1 hypothetical protein QNH39_04545 [Neobacillus novalis]
MLARIILAAVITSVIGFFILPLFFNSGPNEYFLVGWVASTVTVPFTFVVGVISSLIIEHSNNRQQVWVSYLKHIVCSLICVAIFFIYEKLNGGQANDFLIIALIIGFIYTTIFFISDYVTKYFEAMSQKV